MALFSSDRIGGGKVEHGYKGKGSSVHLIMAANGGERQDLPKFLDYLYKEDLSLVEAAKGYDS